MSTRLARMANCHPPQAQLPIANTEAEYKLQGKERYLRVECRDVYGHTAWTNPLYLP